MELTLGAFLGLLEREGLLERVQRPVSTEYECAYWLSAFDGKKAVVFERPIGYEIHVVGNVVCNRRALYLALNAKSDEEVFSKLLHAMENPAPLKVVSALDRFTEASNLSSVPVLRSYEGEAGRYITSGVVIAREPKGDVLNASIHRLLVLDHKRLAIRIVPRHLYRMYERAKSLGVNLPIAIVIGAPPQVYLAAAASPPYGVFELEVANALVGSELEAFEVGEELPVPASSEIVIKGVLRTDVQVPEGPFVDILGTLDAVRMQPVVEVEQVLIREGACYYSILQGGSEHALLMGFPREAAIWDGVRRVVPRVKAVRLIKSGGGWLVAAISLSKSVDGDAKNALLAAFGAHPSLKIAIVVDEDVNVDDLSELLWAIATRVQPHEDLLVIQGARGSSLDPSADEQTLTTSKLGIDATTSLGRNRARFTRARIPLPCEQPSHKLGD